MLEDRAVDHQIFAEQLRVQRMRGEKIRRVHGAGEVGVRGIAVVAPTARPALHIFGQPPVVHQQSSERGLEFRHQVGEGARIHDRALRRLELGQNFQRQCGAGAMHQRGEKGAFHMLAALAGDLLGPQPREPRLAPQILGLGLMTGGVVYLAAQHHRGRNVAHLGDSEPGDRLLQRYDGGARAQGGGISHPHDLPGQRGVGLDQLGELRGIGGVLGGELGELGANARQRRYGLR